MVSTTVGMVDRIHADTTAGRPAVALGLELVVRTASLEERLVETATTSDDADHATRLGAHGLADTGWQLERRLPAFVLMGDDSGVVTRRTSERATVTSLVLDVADGGALGHE